VPLPVNDCTQSGFVHRRQRVRLFCRSVADRALPALILSPPMPGISFSLESSDSPSFGHRSVLEARFSFCSVAQRLSLDFGPAGLCRRVLFRFAFPRSFSQSLVRSPRSARAGRCSHSPHPVLVSSSRPRRVRSLAQLQFLPIWSARSVLPPGQPVFRSSLVIRCPCS
jgi:hypothetical protein